MAKKKGNIDSREWNRRAQEVLKEGKRVLQHNSIKIDLKLDEKDSNRFFQAKNFMTVMAGLLFEFVHEEIFPHIERQLQGKRNAEYGIQYARSAQKQGDRRYKNTGVWWNSDLSKGIKTLGEYMKKAKPTASAAEALVTVGEGIYGLKSNQFNNFGGRSEYESWFLAVEWGTGIAANVGEPWVRAEGRTKDKSGDGSWWFGKQSGSGNFSGTRVLGQKGFHMFWDENTRKPNEFWIKKINERLPVFLRRRLFEIRSRGY